MTLGRELYGIRLEQVKPPRSEKGVYLVFLALVVAVVLTLIAVVLAAGLLSANKTRFLNASNLAALAALERFVRSQSASNSYYERASAAKNQANEVLRAQFLIAGQGTLGDLGFAGEPGEGGVIRFGIWYPENPVAPDPGPCEGDYPCYRDVDPQPSAQTTNPPPPINAVRIEAQAQNAFLAPLRSFLGADRFDLRAKSISAVVQRCTVFLLDASISTTMDNHLFSVPGDPEYQVPAPSPEGFCGINPPLSSRPHYFICPRNSAYFAFDREILWTSEGYLNPKDASSNNSLCNPGANIYTTHGGKVWCNMEWEGNDAYRSAPTPRSSDPSPYNHYVQDYWFIKSQIDGEQRWLVVDMVGEPQPIFSFLLGFNAGLRLLQTQTSTVDKAAILVFKNGIVDQVPDAGFTSELGFLVQLTHGENYKDRDANGQSKEPVYPNWVSRGWLTDSYGMTLTTTGTHISDALKQAIGLLGDTSKCPASAQKSIVLATDGISSCFSDTYPPCSQPATCSISDYTKYEHSETTLLYDDLCTPEAGDSVLKKLLESRIVLTVLLGGRGVMPNFVDRRGGIGAPFLSYEQARALGYSGLPLGADPGNHPEMFFDSRSCCSTSSCDCMVSHCPCNGGHEEAYQKYGKRGVFFLRPNGVFGEMAMRTGGYFCPLNLPLEPEDQYYWDDDSNPATPKVLKDEYRREGFRQTAALRYMSPGAYAAECVQATLGLNPFILVEEE